MTQKKEHPTFIKNIIALLASFKPATVEAHCDTAELADRLFLETMVRIHRMGEGVGFTGVQPSGTEVDPVVAAADEAIALGSDAELLPTVPEDRRAGRALPRPRALGHQHEALGQGGRPVHGPHLWPVQPAADAAGRARRRARHTAGGT